MAKKSRKNAAKARVGTAGQMAEKDETGNETVAFLPTAEVAKRAKCSQEYVRRLERQGIIFKEARDQWHPDTVDDIIAHREKRVPGFDRELVEERTRLVRAQRQRVEYELAERRAELKTREEEAQDRIHLATAVRDRMAVAHERCVKRLGFDKHVSKALAEEIKDAISELVAFAGIEP